MCDFKMLFLTFCKDVEKATKLILEQTRNWSYKQFLSVYSRYARFKHSDWLKWFEQLIIVLGISQLEAHMSTRQFILTNLFSARTEQGVDRRPCGRDRLHLDQHCYVPDLWSGYHEERHLRHVQHTHSGRYERIWSRGYSYKCSTLRIIYTSHSSLRFPQ